MEMDNGVHHVLIVCDMQNDLLNSLEKSKRDVLVDFIDICRSVEKNIVYTGVKFSSGYAETPRNHKIYGGFRRLNEKVGDMGAHWFLDGYEGSRVIYDGVSVCWRSKHLPGNELLSILPSTLTHASIVGIKAAYAVQAISQLLCDHGIEVQVVQECIADDDEGRQEAMIQKFLPIYAEVVSLPVFIHERIGLSDYRCESPLQQRYMANCGRAGHFFLFEPYLKGLHHFPVQYWYDEPLSGKTYQCPLGKRVLDFCDEPQFSKVSMYIKGREWLDEKDLILNIASEYMPETFCFEHGECKCETPSVDSESDAVWFLKDANKNGGRAVSVCPTYDACVSLARSLSSDRFVVQHHISNPALHEGRKCHLKYYCFLQEQNNIWELFTFSSVFLCTSREAWSPSNQNLSCQISTLRDLRLQSSFTGTEHDATLNNVDESVWSARIHETCRDTISQVIQNAIQGGKLKPRSGHRKQFEIFSADFVPTTDGKVFLLEFNFTPVLYDPVYNPDQQLTTKGLSEYARRYREKGSTDDPSVIDDHDMIHSALELAFENEGIVRKGKMEKTSMWISLLVFDGTT